MRSVSTPYWHAAELLTAERGKLVPFRDAAAISCAVRELLHDEPLRHSMRKNAYRLGRDMVWNQVAKLYVQSFERARHDHSFVGRKLSPIKTLDEQPGQLPELKFDHLFRMSDGTGIFQHASFTVPNFAEGYCTDDNARALVLALMLQRLGHTTPRIHAQATTYAAFLNHAFDRPSRRFHNFMSFERRWLDEVGSEDCQGHALWALGLCVRQAGHGSFQMLAAELFEQALPVAAEFTSPRAWAFTLIGIDEYLRRFSGDRRADQIRETLAAKLLQRYADAATDEWHWFEEMVSYSNARLPHAMILSGRCTNNQTLLEIGIKTLRWLTRIQTSESGSFRPIGSNGFYLRGKERSLFDQQPIEARSPSPPALKPFTRQMMRIGLRRPVELSSGSWDEMIWVCRSTIPARAVAAMGCIRTGSARTRELSPRWRSCSPSPKCKLCKIPSPASRSRLPNSVFGARACDYQI
jgi:hypothetical protein